MSEFFFRTEDIRPDDILDYYVETAEDRAIVDAIKARNPVVLIGSRGVGKSFLLRVAEKEMLQEYPEHGVFPVYVTFTKSSLIHTSDPAQFQHWMLARICSYVLRALRKAGLLAVSPRSIAILSGGTADPVVEKSRIEEIAEAFESSWQHPGVNVDTVGLPSVEAVKDAIEDLCEELGLRRIALLIDEAAHIFLPEQQRQFFTLFRDLRSAYVSCNAAVYPGVTAFGETFQPAHDATLHTLERDILSAEYVGTMREIVQKQADSTTMGDIARRGEHFALLAYAANGNPRVLLKTLARAGRMSAPEVNEVVREYYRTDIWAEHTALGEKYPGHRVLVDWGRRFVEDEVLPDLQKKNSQYLEADKKTTCFFWLHRDVPQPVKEALRLLAYTGIVAEHATGIKATRSEVGTRYAAHLGCLVSLESSPTATGFQIARNLTPKRMSEFGANHPLYDSLLAQVPKFEELAGRDLLALQLGKPIDVLDITDWQRKRLEEMGLMSVGQVLAADETKLQEAHYVGEKRARRMRNAALAAVFEFLSG